MAFSFSCARERDWREVRLHVFLLHAGQRTSDESKYLVWRGVQGKHHLNTEYYLACIQAECENFDTIALADYQRSALAAQLKRSVLWYVCAE